MQLPVGMQEFLTSDRPVIRSNALDSMGGHIAIPIGPRRVFVASKDEATSRNFRLSDPMSIVRQSNARVVEAAITFAYGTDTRQMRFIQNRFGTVPQPRLVDRLERKFGSLSS
jgi:hypothetical protein